jgi:hypothetical protein
MSNLSSPVHQSGFEEYIQLERVDFESNEHEADYLILCFHLPDDISNSSTKHGKESCKDYHFQSSYTSKWSTVRVLSDTLI